LAKAEPARWVAVDATQPVETVQAAIRKVVEERLEQG